jgi:hypothetical protein
MRRCTHVVALLLVTPTTTGCAATSSYVPHPDARVALVQERGSYAYFRDGKKYEGGPFGGDIVEAVDGNPQAEEYARQYKAGITTGQTLTWGGLLTALAGLTVVSVDLAQNPHQDSMSSTSTVGFVVAGVGLIAELIGVTVTVNARPHLFDAVNAFNDGLDSQRGTVRR